MKISNNSKILFLDACSPKVQIGILHKNKWIGYFKSEEQALQSLFQGIEISLKMAGIEFEQVTGFAYCEGPGSLLGIRLAAMAIRGWKELNLFKDKEVYKYNSFEVSLELIRKFYSNEGPYCIISRSRSGIWNILTSEERIRVHEIGAEELKKFKGTLWYFQQKKLISEVNDLELRRFDYNLENCPECFSKLELLSIVKEPDALIVKETKYVKWDLKRHSMEDKCDIEFK